MPPKRRRVTEASEQVEEGVRGTKDPDFKDETADVTLISSDLVEFKVHGYYLSVASPVLRDMLKVDSADATKVIELTDECIEHSKVIRGFLQLICTNTFTGFDTLNFELAANVITLLQKYGCDPSLRVMSLLIEAPNTPGLGDHHRFFYACALLDDQAANRLFLGASAARFTRPPGRAEPTVFSSLEGHALDITIMGSQWIDRLPKKYLLALIRASRLRVYPRNEPGPVVAEEFKKQLQLQTEYQILKLLLFDSECVEMSVQSEEDPKTHLCDQGNSFPSLLESKCPDLIGHMYIWINARSERGITGNAAQR